MGEVAAYIPSKILLSTLVHYVVADPERPENPRLCPHGHAETICGLHEAPVGDGKEEVDCFACVLGAPVDENIEELIHAGAGQ